MTTEEDTGLNLEKMGESDSVAKILDELFQKVKNAPEAKAAALKILIDQMYQVAAQMREERQVKQFQALQKQMVKHWKDIQTMCADTPELIDKLEAWKKRFIELKTVSMDLIKGLKDEIADLTQNIQDEWQNMQLHMGIFEGIVMKHCTLGIHAWWKIGFDSQYAKKGKSIDWEPGAGLAFFLAECNKVTTGFTILEGGIPEFEINKFVELFNTGLRDGVARLTKESHLPEAQERVTTLTDLSKELTKNVREVTKQLAGIKIIVDTKMLEAF